MNIIFFIKKLKTFYCTYTKQTNKMTTQFTSAASAATETDTVASAVTETDTVASAVTDTDTVASAATDTDTDLTPQSYMRWMAKRGFI